VTARERPILFSAPMVRAILAGRKSQTRRLLKVLDLRRDVETGHLDGWRTDGHGHWYGYTDAATSGGLGVPATDLLRCPYGVAGDTLYVKETWRTGVALDDLSPTAIRKKALEAGYANPWMPTKYEADGHEVDWQVLDSFGNAWGKTRVSIHMPRWASRITLRITDVRVQRLQEISEDDARAEGVESFLTAFAPISPDQWIVGCPGGQMCRAPCGCFRAGDQPYRASFACLWDDINGDRALWSSDPWVWALTFEVVR